MAVKSITGAWRALSLATSADLTATVAGGLQLLNFKGEDFLEAEPETYYENKDEATGELGPTKHLILNKKLTGKHKCKATSSAIGLFAAMCCGSDTFTANGGNTVGTHIIRPNKAVVDCLGRTFYENDGDAQFKYTGVVCSGFTVSGQRGQFVDLEVDLIGSAAEVTDATAKPAALNESYLAYGNCSLYLGGAYDGTAVTGGTDTSAKMIDFKIGVKNGAKGTYLMGDSSGKVGAIRRGMQFDFDLEANIEIHDRTARTALLAGTEFVLRIPLVGEQIGVTGSNFGAEFVFPRLAYKEVKKATSDGLLKIGAKYSVLADATYGLMVLTVVDAAGVARGSYLV